MPTDCGEEGYGPRMDADGKGTRVEAIPVFGYEEMNV